MNSRQKGARGERCAAAAWAEVMGGAARRGQQFSGGTESPDIVTDFPGIHIEVKRTERGNPYSWLNQAIADAGPDKCPLVLHRRNNQEWIVIARLTDVPRLAAEVAAKAQGLGGGAVPDPVPGAGVPPAGGEDERPPRVFYL